MGTPEDILAGTTFIIPPFPAFFFVQRISVKDFILFLDCEAILRDVTFRTVSILPINTRILFLLEHHSEHLNENQTRLSMSCHHVLESTLLQCKGQYCIDFFRRGAPKARKILVILGAIEEREFCDFVMLQNCAPLPRLQ